MDHLPLVIFFVIICVGLSLGAPVNDAEGSLTEQCLRELGFESAIIDDLSNLNIGRLIGLMEEKLGEKFAKECKRELGFDDKDFRSMCVLDKGRFLGKMDGKYAKIIKDEKEKKDAPTFRHSSAEN